VGPHFKRPRPVVADFVMLSPGSKVTRTIDLGAYYDLSQTGDYALRVDSPATSNTAKAWIEGRANKGRPNPDPDPGSDPLLSFTNCTASQRGLVTQARDVARQYSTVAYNYLASAPSGGTPRYATWFGAHSTSGWNQVLGHFGAIADAFEHAPITVDCKCKKPYYAYVYPNDPYKIYVCKVFWDASVGGTDSKAGTLVHEMSHFDVVAGTDDLAYGKSACMSLAANDPSAARRNADSHEYFAENTPFVQ
jgi:peptidyl-Lys metalloendopeptidase